MRMAGLCAGTRTRWAGPQSWWAAPCVCLLLLASPAHSGWAIVGTAVELDGQTGVPGVLVTAHPDSFSTVADSNGDFILSWSGQAGWVNLAAPNPGQDGKPWCKRIVLPPRAQTAADSTFDIGSVRVNPLMRITEPGKPMPPPGTLFPPRLKIEGPREGEPNEFWMMLRFHADLWGHTTRIEEVGGEPQPQHVRDAVREWIRRAIWIVPRETPCGESDPFTQTLTFPYTWQDSIWAPTPSLGPSRGAGRRQPPATRSNEGR